MKITADVEIILINKIKDSLKSYLEYIDIVDSETKEKHEIKWQLYKKETEKGLLVNISIAFDEKPEGPYNLFS